MRILLAEDERELATWLVRALGQSGFQVDWVDDGRLVRRSLKATAYDALILDLGLPGVGGHDVLAELREADMRLRLETPAGTALPAPVFGRTRALADWTSFQHDFPALYGIGPQGLGDRADARRRAQALQLQGWLLFFDQLMADQLAQLASARRRLSVAPADLNDVARRFSAVGDDRHALATQLVRSIVAWERLYPEAATERALADAIESPAAAARRQQAWLDHLLARVAEDFADYAAATASAFGHDSDRLIGDKCRFLQRVAADVHDRAGAMHQRPASAGEVWNTANVAGVERRIAGLLFTGARTVALLLGKPPVRPAETQKWLAAALGEMGEELGREF